MLASIVTPSYNHAKYIEKTIQSVLDQDYPNIEYIVMDGGSTDGTVNILKKYGSRIKWRSERDAGQSDAINNGFRMAKGDIVAWLNSDDYYLPGAVRKMVDAFQNEPTATMVFGDGYIVDEKDEWKAPYGVEPFFDLWKLIHLYDYISQPSTFMRRDALLSAGLLDVNLYYNLDWELWIRMARTGKVIYIPDKISCARVYPAAKTQAGGWARWREIVDFSRQYGNYKRPPTMFLHVPKGFLRNSRGEFSGSVKSTLSIGRWILYPLTKGRVSGFYQDGYMSRRGFISLPVLKEAEYLVMEIVSPAPMRLSIKINHNEKKQFSIDKGLNTIKIEVDDMVKTRDFLHLEFKSSSAITIPPSGIFPDSRRAAFCMKDIFYINDNGEISNKPGFPNLMTGAL